MTINTTFTSGQVLTASQMNNLPWGVAGRAIITSDVNLTTSFVTMATLTFTAVANRYYRITYFEPYCFTSSQLNSYIHLKIAQGAGSLQQAFLNTPTTTQYFQSMVCTCVTTFSAGSVTLNAQALSTATTGTPLLGRNGDRPAQFFIEDIGPV
jgi:hypothetical protein